MSDPGRPRRRIEPDGPRRSKTPTDPWIITIIAAIVVVALGWFLGQGLAHLIGTRGRPPGPAATMATVPTPSPTPLSTATVAPTSTVKPKPEPTPSKAARTPAPRVTTAPTQAPPTTAPTTAPTVAPTQATVAPTPARTPVPTRKPVIATPAPRRTMVPRPLPPPAPAGSSAAEGVVRGYIDALRRGDPQAAAAYLGNGVPDEDFIDQNTRLVSVESTANSDGSYNVRVAMRTAKGIYTETFVVAGASGSEKILEKSAVKP